MTIMTDSSTLFNAVTEAIFDKTVSNYQLDDVSAEMFLEDADMTQEDGIVMLSGIFISRLIQDGAQFSEVYDDLESDGAGATEALYRMAQECIQDGDLTEQALVTELVDSSMQYSCLEHWDQVFDIMEFCVAKDFPVFNKDRFAKTVGYLYDHYTVEQEIA